MVLRPPAAGNSFLRIQTKPQLCSQQGKEALRAPDPRLVRRKSAGYLKANPPVLPWSNRTDSKYRSMFPDEFRDATARPCVNSHPLNVSPSKHDSPSVAAKRILPAAKPAPVPVRIPVADAGSCPNFHARQINFFAGAVFGRRAPGFQI